MKKVILLSAFILALASCSAPTTEVTAPAADSTCVKADTACIVACDSIKADTAKVK